MKVSDLIDMLETYKDFDLEAIVHLEVADSEYQRSVYGYPVDNYKAQINIDDIGFSDEIVQIGIEILCKED